MKPGTNFTSSDAELLYAQRCNVIICLQTFTSLCSLYHASSFFHSIIPLKDSVSAEIKIFLNYSSTYFQIAKWGNSFKNIPTFCEMEKTLRNEFLYQWVNWKIVPETHDSRLNYFSFPKPSDIIILMLHKSYTTLLNDTELTSTWHFQVIILEAIQ